jgi:hypothetical protein
MAQYLLRKVKTLYEITKFEDSDVPTAVYSFNKRGCNCPASRRGCKHSKIMNTWKSLGEPIGFVFDDDAKHIGSLNVG